MRIIAGQWRGRALSAPPGDTTRPTADRVKQALFDRLLHAPWAGRVVLEGASVLDVFAGTGALGLEALSRSAADAAFIEHDRAALAVLRANIAACGATERCRVVAADATRPPPGRPATLVFMDPPYATDLAAPTLRALHGANWLAPHALLLLELPRGTPPPDLGAPLAHFDAAAATIHALRLPP